ncbi:hypothetical protein ACN6LF_002202 [[Kitasatospora] papulosa]|uniref:hypothetical protein n=2 Tax=Streptomyces TaxID=1883 RepID=UPI0004BE2C25|nr:MULTISPECIES: hypothetical protein [Streptomyces]MCY1649422.1 hypothetical protein [Streptomyces sp. SL203]WSZ45871.1 hypothetical protein OG337_00300 [[Kitasatospora] papulosa]
MSQKRAQAVEIALTELRRAGGYQRGLAARLARADSGGASTWERAVADARATYGAELGADSEAQRPASQPEEDHRHRQGRLRPVVLPLVGPAPRVGPERVPAQRRRLPATARTTSHHTPSPQQGRPGEQGEV